MAARVGVDIGSSAIKVVELSGGGGKFQVESMGLGVNPVGNVQTESQQELTAMAEAVRKIMTDAKIKTKKVATALPESQVYTRVIEVPPLSETELASALAWEAEQYIPVPLAEVNLDWQVVSRPGKDSARPKMEVLLVAAPKAVVGKWVKLIESAGLEPVALETEILAASRSLVREGMSEAMVPTLVCHLGADGTDMAIVENGKLVFAYAVPTGGMALTRLISQGLGLEFVQAEQYKRTYGADEAQLEGKIKQAVLPGLEALAGEVRKALNFYVSRNPATRVTRVILSGGGAQLPGLTAYLAGQLNMEVLVGNPLTGFGFKQQVTNRFEGIENVFSVAVGLAMRQEE